MLLKIPSLIPPDELAECQSLLRSGRWVDGAASAGQIAKQVKNNRQIASDCPNGQRVQQLIQKKLPTNPMFMSAALPHRMTTPRFNAYKNGEYYGTHVDNGVMGLGSPAPIRTDLSATVFFSEPESYDGGELTVVGLFGTETVKLNAGDMVLYPASSFHQVTPVTRGERIAAFFWIQSAIPDNEQRELLYRYDQSLQKLRSELGHSHPEVTQLSGLYHNLLRQWSSV